MIETRFSYEIKLNGSPLDVTQGMVVVKKLQEPLDDGALNIPIAIRDIEYEMFGFLTTRIIGNLGEKNFTYFIQKDEVEPLTKDGIYTHNLTLIEYTYSYDTRLLKALTFTQNLQYNKNATFYVNTSTQGSSYNFANKDFWIPPINFKERYVVGKTTIVPQCIKGYQSIASDTFRRDVFIRIYNPNNVTYNTSQGRYVPSGSYTEEVILSNEPFEMTSTMEGIHLIEYGLVNLFNGEVADPRAVIFTFTLNFIEESKYTLYDYVDRIRRVVPLETKAYHEETRLFDLDANLVERFKSVIMPQIFITQMTLRQTLNTLFKFINAIMRLEYVEDGLDTLTIDEFNKVIGSFELTQMVDYKTSQNIQGYGTKITSWLENTLQSNFRDNPTVKTPSNNFFKTVRAKNVQLTQSQNGFILPLDGGEIYELGKVTVQIPKIQYGGYTISNNEPFTNLFNFELDLSDRTIPLEEWNIKNVTNDFPNYAVEGMCSIFVGLRKNKGGNIYWERGKDHIDFSKEFGAWFSDVLIVQTVKEALAEYFTLNAPLSFLPDGSLDRVTGFVVENIDEDWFYKNISFNVEYTTLKSTIVKNHRQDISVFKKDTEIRLNQNSRITDFKLATKNAVGNIERMGVPNKTFAKIHTDIGELLEVAMQDGDGYVITQATYELNNDYIIGNYEVTKDHIRLSEFMGIDRAYRAFAVPKGNQVYDRDEHYEDFIIVDTLSSSLIPERVLFNNQFVNKCFKTLTSKDLTPHKISYAFVRTDGFSKIYKDENTFYKAIMTPVSSYGGEQVLLFTFGFNSNLVAGNAIYKRGGNYYNDPIRYTDQLGRFEELWFGMGDTTVETWAFPEIASSEQTAFNKTYAYPLVQSQFEDFNQNFSISTGDVEGESYNPIIFSKDPSEVLRSMNYQVNIMALDYKKYVIGTNFFTNNRLVFNIKDVEKLYLYKYKDGTTYDIFDTILAKTDETLYDFDKVELDRALGNGNIIYLEYANGTSIVRFINNGVIGSQHTSWAIANEDGELYFACNTNENGFRLIPKHFRPNIEPLSLQITSNYKVDLEDTLVLNVDFDIIRFEFPSPSLSDTLQLRAFFDITKSTDNQFSLQDTLSLNATFTLSKFEYPTLSFEDTLEIDTSFNIIQSTDYVMYMNDNLSLSASFNIVQSTDNIIGSLNDTLSLNASFQVLKTENQNFDYEDTLNLSVSFNITQSTDYNVGVLSDTLTVNLPMTITKTEFSWNYIGLLGAYDLSVDFDSSVCESIGSTTLWLQNNYPAKNYDDGYVIRVQRLANGTPCSPQYYYFEVVYS